MLVAGAWAGVYCGVSVLRVLGVAVSPSMWIITSPAPLWTLWTPQLFSCDNHVQRYSKSSEDLGKVPTPCLNLLLAHYHGFKDLCLTKNMHW